MRRRQLTVDSSTLFCGKKKPATTPELEHHFFPQAPKSYRLAPTPNDHFMSDDQPPAIVEVSEQTSANLATAFDEAWKGRSVEQAFT